MGNQGRCDASALFWGDSMSWWMVIELVIVVLAVWGVLYLVARAEQDDDPFV